MFQFLKLYWPPETTTIYHVLKIDYSLKRPHPEKTVMFMNQLIIYFLSFFCNLILFNILYTWKDVSKETYQNHSKP